MYFYECKQLPIPDGDYTVPVDEKPSKEYKALDTSTFLRVQSI
jgi:hypothetical protein